MTEVETPCLFLDPPLLEQAKAAPEQLGRQRTWYHRGRVLPNHVRDVGPARGSESD